MCPGSHDTNDQHQHHTDHQNNNPDSGNPHENPDNHAQSSGDEHSDAHYGYISDKEKYLARVRRIEGQARGIHRMIEEDTYCVDILTQVSAMTSALENLALGLLDDHLAHCVTHALGSGEDAEEKIQEASQAIQRLVKS